MKTHCGIKKRVGKSSIEIPVSKGLDIMHVAISTFKADSIL